MLAVLTGADVRADGLGTLPSVKDARVEMTRRDGSPGYYPPQPILAEGRVRHVGERVALVVAETEAQARHGAELVQIDYGELPAVVAAADAVAEIQAEQPRAAFQAVVDRWLEAAEAGPR